LNVLSIQSEVAYGYVGNRAARFALERLGFGAWTIPTVLLSNHAGYPHVQGEAIPADLMQRLLDGLDANGWLGRCDAVLSGYLGSAEQAQVVAETVARVKRANPKAIYCLDTVFGDGGRIYAQPGVQEAMARELLPLADVVTPNVFELSVLSGTEISDAATARAAAEKLRRPLIVVTSVPTAGAIGVLAVEDEDAWLASTPKLARVPHGSGDIFAALFLAARLSGRSAADALARATASVFAVLSKSEGAGEMDLPAEQDVLVDPPLSSVRIEALA
jgi:pyridoxine kinase